MTPSAAVRRAHAPTTSWSRCCAPSASATAADQLDSKTLGRCLGWTAAQTADSLAAAKARLLIWGIRVGGNPGPCFEDIELTVQGRRFLIASET